MADTRYCRMCGAPIFLVRGEGLLLRVDRQQTLDGDLSLREAHGGLVAERTAIGGGGLYREHVCGFNSSESDNSASTAAQDLVNALDKADRVRKRAVPKRGTMGFALQVLAREVRAQRASTRRNTDGHG